jgi:hypothetical protein
LSTSHHLHEIDTETLRKGSPHGLIYKRGVAQRKQDLADLATLNAETGTRAAEPKPRK